MRQQAHGEPTSPPSERAEAARSRLLNCHSNCMRRRRAGPEVRPPSVLCFGRVKMSLRASVRVRGLIGAVGVVTIGVAGASLLLSRRPSVERPRSEEARRILATLRSLPSAPLSDRPTAASLEGKVPEQPPAAPSAAARVTLPRLASSPSHLEDGATHVSVDVAVQEARDVPAVSVDGYSVYAHAHRSGATILERVLPTGAEDFVSFETRPAAPDVGYQITLGDGVSGLRLVADTLEMLDAGGTPRLRVEPPYIVGADGATTNAVLAVEGCALDTDPAAPWGRAVTAPGARTCTVRVSWPADQVVYPAVLDPRWTTTGTMISARQDHTAIRLSTGKVLVANGRTSPTSTTGLLTAELFDPATSTWAATGSMATGLGRWSATATQLNTSSNTTTSGKVLVSGGINGTASVNTAQLYSVTAGTWTAAANLNAARHLHTATLMPNGNVLAAGGMNGTSVLNTAAIYNPASGTGTWTAVATTMASARRSHTATLLASSNSSFNNKVLIVGGNSGGTTSLTSVQLFDTSALTWSTTTALPSAREGQTATALANGNVLVTGGKSGTATLATTLLFTIPSSGTAATWPSAGTMTSMRSAHTATLLATGVLNNGSLLVAGGSNGTSTVATAELWNGTSTWTATTALPAAVQAHTATLLSSGAVLLASGLNRSTTINLGRVYDPSFALACTTNSQCATGFCVNGVCCDTACTNQCSACNLSGSVGTCSPKANGTSCNDSNACTTGETCQSGSCSGGTAVTCATPDQCHTQSACVPATGCPAPVAKADGTTCDDGDACTRTDTCQTGTCTGGTRTSCAPSDQCRTAGTCNPATGFCSSSPVADGVACNDGNSCTTGDACHAGVCLPGSVNACTSAGQAKYVTVIDFGSAQGWSFGSGINNHGVVVGTDTLPTSGIHASTLPGSRAFRWTEAEGMVYLPSSWSSSNAFDINESGVICGTGGVQPFRYDPSVDSLPEIQPYAGDAYRINDAGTATGDMYFPAGHSMFRLNSGAADALPWAPDPGGAIAAVGLAIDDSGTRVVGQQLRGDMTWHAVRYMDGRNTEFLDDLLPSGSSWALITAYQVTPQNIIGWGNHDGVGRAYRITTASDGSVVDIIDLGMPETFAPNAPNVVWAADINASGEIVGSVYDDLPFWPKAPFVYTDATGIVDLNTLIDPQSGWLLLGGFAINDNHEVVGYGYHNGFDNSHLRAYKLKLPDLSPCPPPDSCHQQGTRDVLTGQCSNPIALDQTAGPPWTSKASLATPRYAPAGVALGGLTYVFGGCDAPPCGNAVSATVEAYDPTQNAWSPRAPMPTARQTTAAATINGTIYVVGGDGGDTFLGSTTVEAYDPVHDSWTTRASMSVGRSGPAIGAIGGKLYVTGGHCCNDKGAIPPDFVDSYDPATDTWTARGPVPTQRAYPASGVIGSKLYVAGGLAPDRTLLDTLEAYDPATDTWTSLKRMPSALEGPGAAVVDGQLFVIGGSTASSNSPFAVVNQVYVYDPAVDTWSLGPTMTTSRGGAVATANGETILVSGGYAASGPINVVEALSPLRGPACEDGNACTQGESCQAGSCQTDKSFPLVVDLSVTDLGNLGGSPTMAAAVNMGPDIVGVGTTASGQQHAFISFGGGQPLFDISAQPGAPALSVAAAISDTEIEVGSLPQPDGSSHVFSRTDATGLVDLGPVGDNPVATDTSPLRGAYGYAVNNSGQIAGVDTAGGQFHGFRYTPGIGFQDISTLDGRGSWAFGLSASGTVVGASLVPNTPLTGLQRFGHAVLFNDTAGLVDLNRYVDPTSGLTLALANAISGTYIVGAAGEMGTVVPFRLNTGTGAIDTFNGGWQGSTYATSVNDMGDTVGWGFLDAGGTKQSAFIYTDGIGFKNLNEVIDHASGWNIQVANGINDRDDIVGWGYHNGVVSSFLLRVSPETIACPSPNNACGGSGSGVCLWSDGVVDNGNGTFTAVFGFSNGGTTSAKPTINNVLVDGSVVPNPNPAPPELGLGTTLP